jgi:hypothetical protein
VLWKSGIYAEGGRCRQREAPSEAPARQHGGATRAEVRSTCCCWSLGVMEVVGIRSRWGVEMAGLEIEPEVG